MGKIEWAPINVPLRRRMQTFSTGVTLSISIFCGLFGHLLWIIALLLGNIYIKVSLVLYAAWIYFDQDRALESARGSGLLWMRNNFFWKHFGDYFPAKLVKTAELPPNRNYLLACFPHGILGLTIFSNMAVNIGKWTELFPKVRPHLSMLAFNFNTPFWREFIQAWGMISVTRMSLLNNLTVSNDPQDPINSDGFTASAVAVLVGGSQEALDAKPGKYIITIKNRKGFVKLAMRSGAAIVPVFSFGEVDVYDQVDNPPGSTVRKIQLYVKKITGISPVFFRGRGFFQYTFGLLPFRRQIVQVVGAPIDVPQLDNPTEEEVDKIHQQCMDDLNELFETHKWKYLEDAASTVLVMN